MPSLDPISTRPLRTATDLLHTLIRLDAGHFPSVPAWQRITLTPSTYASVTAWLRAHPPLSTSLRAHLMYAPFPPPPLPHSRLC